MKNSTKKSTIAKANVNAENVNVAPIENVNPIADQKGLISEEKLKKINALNISESIAERSGRKAIFKKEFNNKTDRTKCRSKFQNAISLFLLHISKGKQDLADQKMIEIKEIANTYYVAESSFKNANDYFTDGLSLEKKSLIKTFIEILQD